MKLTLFSPDPAAGEYEPENFEPTDQGKPLLPAAGPAGGYRIEHSGQRSGSTVDLLFFQRCYHSKDQTEKVRTFGKNVLLERPGQPSGIAPAYVLLASDAGSFLTGQMIHVNGGEIVGA